MSAPCAASPGTGSDGILPSERTYATRFARSSSSNSQPSGMTGGMPSAIRAFNAASSGACASRARWRDGPRPPLPSIPWHRAQCRSNNFLPAAASPRGDFFAAGVCPGQATVSSPEPSTPPKTKSTSLFTRTSVPIGGSRKNPGQWQGRVPLAFQPVNCNPQRKVGEGHPMWYEKRIVYWNVICGVSIMRALLIAAAICAGIGVLAWATAKPNDGRANAKAAFPKPAVDVPLAAAKAQETAVLSGGCFWGIQAMFQHVKGVVSATSGYSGGAAGTAHYEEVSSGETGHAESVRIVFDSSQISYGQILMIFFSVGHNPTELNRQGPDYGTQYRSSIFYSNEEQKKIAGAYIAQLNAAKIYSQ